MRTSGGGGGVSGGNLGGGGGGLVDSPRSRESLEKEARDSTKL